MGAQGLRAVNMSGHDSDPYAKVKVFRHEVEGKGKVPRWRFQTEVSWKTLSPTWKEK